MSIALRALLVCLVALSAHAEEPVLSKDASPDKPVSTTTDAETEKMHRAMEPYVRQARKTYPAAKARYLKGLPPGEHFFVTTRLRDAKGRIEQVFIAVTAIEKEITLPLESTVFTLVKPAFSNAFFNSGIFAFIGLTPRSKAT